MGMIAVWTPVDAATVDEVAAMDPTPFVMGRFGGGGGFDVDKAWHGIHATLTGSAWDTHHELAGAVLGGVEFGDDLGYGPARFLTPAEVASVAARLEAIDTDAFAAMVDLPRLAAQDVYGGSWDDEDDDLAYLVEGYGVIRQGYRDAAADGRGMVLVIS